MAKAAGQAGGPILTPARGHPRVPRGDSDCGTGERGLHSERDKKPPTGGAGRGPPAPHRRAGTPRLARTPELTVTSVAAPATRHPSLPRSLPPLSGHLFQTRRGPAGARAAPATQGWGRHLSPGDLNLGRGEQCSFFVM